MPTILGCHLLEDGGTLHLIVERLANGNWRPHAHCTDESVVARLSPVETERAAMGLLQTWMKQQFPEHSCAKMRCQTLE